MAEIEISKEERERLNRQHLRALKVKKIRRMDYETLRSQRGGEDQDVGDDVNSSGIEVPLEPETGGGGGGADLEKPGAWPK